ncbi:endodeoxyribonuclease RusA family protein [Lyngbya aestuarii BL J]|uniref:Endodeoxyribonuclease RusA family protein n=1 Tax=Lyngbya aestuarii BL J TaxID=1348334 RepID=U7QIM0_9CYAN|nr:RusA family crossover junction endodeoxyribonuclease [Lyngbya aestuarii]ERT06276.1 endodeoxyribonuclease RusA family protein [Lyngbya aestuarii BL J]
MNSPLNVITDSIFALPKPKNDQLDQFATRIHQEHQLCIQSPKTSLIHACNAGALLLKAQPFVSTQTWENWLKTQCNLTLQTAQMYMRMAGKYPQVQDNIERSILSPQNPSQADSPRFLTESKTESQVVVKPTSSPTQPQSKPSPEQLKQQPSPVSSPKESVIESIIDVDFTPISGNSESNSEPNSIGDLVRFCLSGTVVPKARPRVTSNGTYMPNRYREWRNRAEIELYRQMSQFHSTHKFPLQKAAVALRFFGNHRTNSDLDNMAGACLDALTLNGAGVLMDDRLSCLPRLTVEYVSGTKETGVWIEIQPL